MIKVETSVTKEMITPLATHKGHANSHPVVHDGVEHPAGAIVFRGFAGAINMETRDYDGVLRFDDKVTGDEPRIDFQGFRGFEAVAEVESVEETSDGTDSDPDGDLDRGNENGQPDE